MHMDINFISSSEIFLIILNYNQVLVEKIFSV